MELVRPSRVKQPPVITVPKIIIRLEPYLSTRAPMNGPDIQTKAEMDIAQDSCPRLQPNSSMRGMKNTPKPFQTMPPPSKTVMAPIMTTHQP